MKTFVYKLVDLDLKDRNVLLDIQKKWSISYRKLYNNLELSVDKEYLKSLNVSSARLLEALVKEVLTLNERINGNMGLKEKLKKKVAEIEIRILVMIQTVYIHGKVCLGLICIRVTDVKRRFY